MSISVTGLATSGKSHEWHFPVPGSALRINAAGNGALEVPPVKILPYGILSLTITPVGEATTDSCEGTPSDKVQKVKLAGSVFFDTKSSGADRWGSVGSRSTKKRFTFTSKSTLTWFYPRPPGGSSCGGDDDSGLPCSGALVWDDASGDADFSGISTGGVSLIEASRSVQLATPVGATRADDLTGAGPAPVLTTTPGAADAAENDATLTVTADTNAAGGATIVSATPSQTQTIPCDGDVTGSTTSASLWEGATFTNGTAPITVAAEIFGPVSIPNNTDATIVDVVPTG
jgi:hypothetical protein